MISLAADLHFAGQSPALSLLGPDWSRERRFCWSVGHRSGFVLPAPKGNGRVGLELSLEPFLWPPALRYQRLRVGVNGTLIGERRLGGKLDWWLDVPEEAAQGNLRLVLECPDAATPRSLGAGADDRILGFALSRAALYRDTAAPCPAPMQPMQEFAFNWNESTEEYLLEGWDTPEDQYVWSLGRRSRLLVPVDGSGTPVLVMLDMQPYLEEKKLELQRIVIGADDKLVTFLKLPCQTAVALPVSPAPGRTHVELSFDHLDSDQGSPEKRHMHGLPFGFMLFSMRVLPAPPPAPPAGIPALTGTIADGSLQAQIMTATGLAPEALAARFESLGNGCALGVLQQQLGVARPGLLQFTEWWQPMLINGLLHDFAHLGRPERLEWIERHTTDPMWLVRDAQYSIGAPTTHDKSAPPPPRAVAREPARAARLAEKLLEDLAANEKIFAFRTGAPLTERGAEALRAALARRSDVTALWLTDGPPELWGSVEQISHGLLRGYHPASAHHMDQLLSVLAGAWVLREHARRK
jgi:hypothetical protein